MPEVTFKTANEYAIEAIDTEIRRAQDSVTWYKDAIKRGTNAVETKEASLANVKKNIEEMKTSIDSMQRQKKEAERKIKNLKVVRERLKES